MAKKQPATAALKPEGGKKKIKQWKINKYGHNWSKKRGEKIM